MIITVDKIFDSVDIELITADTTYVDWKKISETETTMTIEIQD